MTASLINHPSGEYRFLPGIDPYSCGVIGMPGWEIVHVALARPRRWREGLLGIRSYLEGIGRHRHSLCGVELRCPAPYSLEVFIEFNSQYRDVLEEWDMIVDGMNPLARTNVAPVHRPPSEPVIYGFSYAIPSDVKRLTFVIAGAGELREGVLEETRIVRCGETGVDALLEKSRYVVQVMRERLAGLGATAELLSTINVYTAHPLRQPLAEIIIPGISASDWLGVHWFHARPPVQDIEFEMDMRGVARHIVVDIE